MTAPLKASQSLTISDSAARAGKPLRLSSLIIDTGSVGFAAIRSGVDPDQDRLDEFLTRTFASAGISAAGVLGGASTANAGANIRSPADTMTLAMRRFRQGKRLAAFTKALVARAVVPCRAQLSFALADVAASLKSVVIGQYANNGLSAVARGPLPHGSAVMVPTTLAGATAALQQIGAGVDARTRRIEELEGDGYRFEITPEGFDVWRFGEHVAGDLDSHASLADLELSRESAVAAAETDRDRRRSNVFPIALGRCSAAA